MYEESVQSTDAKRPSADVASVDRTITNSPATDLAPFIAGFVAGEGTFTHTRRNFTFAVALGETDARSCELLHAFFAVGHVYHYPRRKPHYDDEVAFQVRKTSDLVHVIIPFMDEHLPPSFKRVQYLAWRAQVMEYWDRGMKRRRTCTVDGCEQPQRGRGVCRHHYYRLYGI